MSGELTSLLVLIAGGTLAAGMAWSAWDDTHDALATTARISRRRRAARAWTVTAVGLALTFLAVLIAH